MPTFMVHLLLEVGFLNEACDVIIKKRGRRRQTKGEIKHFSHLKMRKLKNTTIIHEGCIKPNKKDLLLEICAIILGFFSY